LVCEYAPPTNTKPTAIRATLYDLSGRMVGQQQMEKFEKTFRTQFNVTSLQSGTFFAIFEEEGKPMRVVHTIQKL